MRNKSMIFLLVGFLAVKAGMCGEDQLSRQEILRKSTQHYEVGQRFYSQGDFVRADEEFRKAQELLDYLASERTTSGQQIRELPKEAIKSNESKQGGGGKLINYQDYLKVAIESSKTGDSKKAIFNYLKAIELNPDNSDLHYNLAVEYLKSKQFEKAAEELQKTVQLNPRDKDAYYNLGVLYEGYLGNLKLARFYFSQYVKLAKKEADVDEVNSWIRQIDKKIRLEKGTNNDR